MKKLSKIDFDGARIISAHRETADLTIEFIIVGLSSPVTVVFYSITEEASEFFTGDGVPVKNENFPPLDVIETFKENNGVCQFGGYLKNKPWATWQFKTNKCVVL